MLLNPSQEEREYRFNRYLSYSTALPRCVPLASSVGHDLNTWQHSKDVQSIESENRLAEGVLAVPLLARSMR